MNRSADKRLLRDDAVAVGAGGGFDTVAAAGPGEDVVDGIALRHKNAFMRTTIDLPDDLLRQVKARAALNGLKLKELITHYVEQGLKQGARPDAAHEPSGRQRSPLPVIEKAATGTPITALSHDELAQIEQNDDFAKHDRSARR